MLSVVLVHLVLREFPVLGMHIILRKICTTASSSSTGVSCGGGGVSCGGGGVVAGGSSSLVDGSASAA